MRNVRKIIGIIFGSIGLGIVVFMPLKGWHDRKKFYNSQIKSIAITQNDWLVHAKTFYLADGNSIDFFLPVDDKFKLYDSVYKPSDTYIYSVYRKNSSGAYEFFRKYNYEDSN